MSFSFNVDTEKRVVEFCFEYFFYARHQSSAKERRSKLHDLLRYSNDVAVVPWSLTTNFGLPFEIPGLYSADQRGPISNRHVPGLDLVDP
jgi:hypothetical protein